MWRSKLLKTPGWVCEKMGPKRGTKSWHRRAWRRSKFTSARGSWIYEDMLVTSREKKIGNWSKSWKVNQFVLGFLNLDLLRSEDLPANGTLTRKIWSEANQQTRKHIYWVLLRCFCWHWSTVMLIKKKLELCTLTSVLCERNSTDGGGCKELDLNWNPRCFNGCFVEWTRLWCGAGQEFQRELQGTFEKDSSDTKFRKISFGGIPNSSIRNLPPEPAPARTGSLRKLPEPASGTCTSTHRKPPETSGTCLRNLHQHAPEASGNFRNLPPEPAPARTGSLRKLPEPASGTCTSTHRKPPETSGTCLRNLHQHAPEASGNFRNLPPEPAPARTGSLRKLPEPASGTCTSTHRKPPETSGTCLRNLHQHAPEASGNFRNLPPEPTPARAGTLRNPPEPSSRTCSCDPHRHTGAYLGWRPH